MFLESVVYRRTWGWGEGDWEEDNGKGIKEEEMGRGIVKGDYKWMRINEKKDTWRGSKRRGSN